jgi:hypothetical protein
MMDAQRCVRDDGSAFYHKEKPSRKLSKAVIDEQIVQVQGVAPWQHWENDHYYGSLRHYATGNFINGGPWAAIGITNKDESAHHDWRDFQQIKNDLVGVEWDGLEIYPAESRLCDPSNRFYLWCFPPGLIAKLGECMGAAFSKRVVYGPKDGAPPQRPFPGRMSTTAS